MNTLRIFSIVTIALLLAGTGVAEAQMGMMGSAENGNIAATRYIQSPELRETLQDIYESQNVLNQEDMSCAAVTDEQFERLGDTYMSVLHPDEAQHEAMDAMMGGEGSDSLRQAHINMGRSYLGCWSDYDSYPLSMPMMGWNGMMGNGSYGPDFNSFNQHSMMGYGFGGFGGSLLMVLFWILIIIGIVALVKYTMGVGSQHREDSLKDALAILKERYAKGEIDKEEFEAKKKDLFD